jgi:hypothetical protein
VTSRHLIAIGVVAFLLSAAVLSTTLDDQADEALSAPDYSPLPTTTAKVEITPQRDVAARLKEIMRIREEAYRVRSPEMLRSIYSVDCPCLASDERAINELIDRDHVWRGIATSIDIRSVRRISETLLIVTALFRSSALRVETEGGRLVRIEPAGSDLFQFTLVKPRDADQFLLGLATALEGNR